MDIFKKFYLGHIRSAQIRIALFLYKIDEGPAQMDSKDFCLGQT